MLEQLAMEVARQGPLVIVFGVACWKLLQMYDREKKARIKLSEEFNQYLKDQNKELATTIEADTRIKARLLTQLEKTKGG